MTNFFKVYKKTRKIYNIFIIILSVFLFAEIGILTYEGHIYFKYGSTELLKWFDYGNGDINFDGVTDETDVSLLQTAITPNYMSDNSYDQEGINYILEQNVKSYLGVDGFDEYLLKRMRNRADCSKSNPQIIDINDLSNLDKLSKN